MESPNQSNVEIPPEVEHRFNLAESRAQLWLDEQADPTAESALFGFAERLFAAFACEALATNDPVDGKRLHTERYIYRTLDWIFDNRSLGGDRDAFIARGSAHVRASSAWREFQRSLMGRPKGRPIGSQLDGAEVRAARGDLTQPVFARKWKVKVDAVQRAEGGKSLSDSNYRKLFKAVEEHQKNTPQKLR